ncbi:MAG: lysyl oxidase family protein [Microgenomates group bacterium]
MTEFTANTNRSTQPAEKQWYVHRMNLIQIPAVKDLFRGLKYRYALGLAFIAFLTVACGGVSQVQTETTNEGQTTYAVPSESGSEVYAPTAVSIPTAQDVPTLTPGEVQTAVGTGNSNNDDSYIDYIDGMPVPLDQVFIQPIETATAGTRILYPDLTIVPSPNPEFEFGLSEDRRTFYFPTTFANIGPGPLRLQAAGLETSESGASMNVVQILYAKDELTGQVVAYESPAGSFAHHPSHGHFHFENFVTVQISVPATGEVITVDKASFCIQDGNLAMDPFHPGIVALSQGDAPPNPVYQGCGALVQGISPRYVDHYGRNVPGQMVEFAGPLAPNTTVIVQITLNPAGILQEGNLANNSFEQVLVFP